MQKVVLPNPPAQLRSETCGWCFCSAIVTSETATLYKLSRASVESMMLESPRLLAVVHSVMLKSNYRSTTQFLEAYV